MSGAKKRPLDPEAGGASKRVRQESSRSSRGPIDLKSFYKPSYADDEEKCLTPTSQWTLEPLKKFCNLGFKSGLGFTKQRLEAIPLLPEAEAFAACRSHKDDIAADNRPLNLTDVPVDARPYIKKTVDAAFAQLRSAIKQYVVDPEQSKTEKKIDSLALRLADLCGFDDGKEFEISGMKIGFKFAGKDINREADVYVAKRTGDSDQVVLLWADKLPSMVTSVNERLLHDTAAQIVGAMISVHWKNRSHKHEPLEVYAVRLIDDMVAFFRMKMTAEQIKAVCDDGVIPSTKLQVDYVPRKALDAGNKYGVSLLTPSNRRWFVQMMACIRAELAQREVPKPTHFESRKDGEDADPSQL